MPRIPPSITRGKNSKNKPPAPSEAEAHGISINFSSTLKTPASGVTGMMNINLSQVKAKGVTEVVVKLIGEARTYVLPKCLISQPLSRCLCIVESR